MCYFCKLQFLRKNHQMKKFLNRFLKSSPVQKIIPDHYLHTKNWVYHLRASWLSLSNSCLGLEFTWKNKHNFILRNQTATATHRDELLGKWVELPDGSFYNLTDDALYEQLRIDNKDNLPLLELVMIFFKKSNHRSNMGDIIKLQDQILKVIGQIVYNNLAITEGEVQDFSKQINTVLSSYQSVNKKLSNKIADCEIVKKADSILEKNSSYRLTHQRVLLLSEELSKINDGRALYEELKEVVVNHEKYFDRSIGQELVAKEVIGDAIKNLKLLAS